MRTRRAPAVLAAAAALAAAATGCGGTGDGDGDARATVTRYFAALGAGRPPAACQELTGESQDKLAEFGTDALKLRGHSCAATFQALFESAAGPGLKTLGHARVTRVRREGDHEAISVRGVARPVEVVRDDGHWRIRSEPLLEKD
jgi:hypothetical protein